MNFLQKAYDNAMGRISGMDEVGELRDELVEYYDNSLEDATEKVGHNKYVNSPVSNYDDIGGRPAPLNPDKYPTWQELDAIRHYYGPQLMSETGGAYGGESTWGGIKSVIGPAWHELEGFAKGEGWGQIGPDLYNNMVSVKDEMLGDDRMPARGLLNRLKAFDNGGMPKGEFEQFSKHALDRTIIPPKWEGDEY